MESIVVHPENAEQLKVVTDFLKALKIQFESQPVVLPNCVSENVDPILKQTENNQTITIQEFSYKYF